MKSIPRRCRQRTACWGLLTTSSVKNSFTAVLAIHLLLFLLLPSLCGAVSGERIRQQIVRHIEQSMPWPKEDVRIDVHTPPDIAGLAKEGSTIRVEIVGAEDYVGEMTFMVRVSDGKQQRQVIVHGRMEVLRDVVVSGRPLVRDMVVTADDIKIKKKWVRHLDPDLLSSRENAVGKSLLMAVRGGAELKSTMLKEPVVVKKGRTVRIHVERGAMLITTMGISEQDGSTGSTIKVRNMSSNRLVYARVIGEGTVRVDY